MAKNMEFTYDNESGISTCIINDGTHFFKGVAKCDPQDIDFQSEKTGCAIALFRAQIQAWKFRKEYSLAQIDIINHIMSIIKSSSRYQRNSNEIRVIQKQLQNCIEDYQLAADTIVGLKKQLKEYIDSKDEFYQKVRKNRKKVTQN